MWLRQEGTCPLCRERGPHPVWVVYYHTDDHLYPVISDFRDRTNGVWVLRIIRELIPRIPGNRGGPPPLIPAMDWDLELFATRDEPEP